MGANSQKERSGGRSARKRLRKRLLREELGESIDGEEFRKILQSLPAAEAVQLVKGLWSEKQLAIAEQYFSDLREISCRLGGEGAWSYFEQNRADASKWGLEGVLRELALDAAGRFSDPRQLRLTARHGKK